MADFSQDHDYSNDDDFVEIAFGFEAYECAIENRSTSATLEVSKNGYEVIGEIPPGASFGLGGPIESIWIARAYASGDPEEEHVAHVTAWTQQDPPAPPEPEPEPEPDPLVPALKQERYGTIDARTRDLIERGFVHAGKTFSLSDRAQLNWISMYTLRELLEYPITVNVIDDSDVFDIVDAAALAAFVLAALGTVAVHVASGTALKTQIRAATTVAGLYAVVDSRGL